MDCALELETKLKTRIQLKDKGALLQAILYEI